MMLVIMAGTDTFDMGRFLSYLFAYALQQIILLITYDACRAVASFPVTDPSWPLQGNHRPRPRKRVKRVTKSSDNENYKMSLGRTYLFPLGITIVRVGCCIELFFWRLHHILGRPPHPHFRAILSNEGDQETTQYVHFDTDSYPIGVT
jgi:hypothetical protein